MSLRCIGLTQEDFSFIRFTEIVPQVYPTRKALPNATLRRPCIVQKKNLIPVCESPAPNAASVQTT